MTPSSGDAADPLARSRAFARAIRYQGEALDDAAAARTGAIAGGAAPAVEFDGLEVTPDLTPGIAASVGRASSRLFAPPGRIRAFVHPSADIAASCLTLDDATCYVRLSSALAESFDDEELTFVVGHELGHHLLDHSRVGLDGLGRLARYALMRAREISCDRLGLVACGGVEPAMRAIMKTVSGLTERRLRFDSAAYLRSATAGHDRPEGQHVLATHPPMPVRARALLGFDEVNRAHYPDFDRRPAREAFRRMDDRVRRDMQRFVERKADAEANRLFEDARGWISLGAAVADGRLDATTRKALATRLPPDFLNAARRALGAMSVREAQRFVRDKAGVAATRYAEEDVREARRRLEVEVRDSEQALLNGRPANVARQSLKT